MKIFQLFGEQLIEIKSEFLENGKSFDYEKTLQTMIENNLSDIFPNIRFVKTEHKIEDLKPDTIAFDDKKRSFVIIEYKNKKNKSMTDQGMSYYKMINDSKANLVLLYNKIFGGTYDVPDFNWNETKVIFISPQFTKYQKEASDYAKLPIELYKIQRYQNNIFTLSPINKKTDKISEPKPTPQNPRPTEYSEKDYLDGKYSNVYPTQETKKLWHKLKNAILDATQDLEFKQTKIYAGFYHTQTNKCFYTLNTTKNKVILAYAISKKGILPDSEFVEDMTNKGHHGLGSFRSHISNNSDIQKAIPLIKKVYSYKIQS